jgi:hypothetical protein
MDYTRITLSQKKTKGLLLGCYKYERCINIKLSVTWLSEYHVLRFVILDRNSGNQNIATNSFQGQSGPKFVADSLSPSSVKF